MPIQFYHKEKIPKVYDGILNFRKYEPDASVSRQENAFLLPDLYYLESKNKLKFFEKIFVKQRTNSILKSAERILVFSEFQKQAILKKFPFLKEKFEIIIPGMDVSLRPFDDDAKDTVRYQWTEGCAYFIFVGPIHPSAELMNLLKGFSIFKKRIGSNMRLVLCGHQDKSSVEFLELLDTYKYKNDVLLVEEYNDYEKESLIASAYAMIHVNKWDRFGTPIHMAMKLGCPVLVPENSSHAEFAGMAGMHVRIEDPQDIGEKMQRIFKDEQMRSEMIGTGLLRVEG